MNRNGLARCGAMLSLSLCSAPSSACASIAFAHTSGPALPRQLSGNGDWRLVVAMMALYPFAIFPVFPELQIGLLRLLALFGMHPQGIGFGAAPFLLTLCIYVVCWLLLPLRLYEVLFPLVPISVVSVVAVLISPRDPNKIEAIVAILVVAALVAVPGVLISIVRESRFVRGVIDRAVKARYIELREDLETARRIHDRLMPDALNTGPMLVDLAYEPMREIGGDMLFIHQSGLKNSAVTAVHLTLIDVTGHGITAALAVHRLHGELLRIFGTQDDPTPVRVMSLLNDYLLLTTSHDSLFATALVVRIDADTGAVTFASAAHPDAMIRAVDGSVRRLASTTCVLGACPAECFDADLAHATLDRGETLILFTDGLNEATSRLCGAGRLHHRARPAGFGVKPLNRPWQRPSARCCRWNGR
ncbi:MAG: PP2C family protein-serine/threonine phosphatase [Phycisphaerae bacterium]|nr:PP2C family protein-serine/threonine phosphatase [Phycisphaerae bacterium]